MQSNRLLLALILAVSALAYGPGLSGGFLFDDDATLSGLRTVQSEPSAYTATQYVLGGHSSDLGRPLSLLSFAVQSSSWDQRPVDFIALNLALHLVNGALWFLLLSSLQRARVPSLSRPVVLAATALWLLLPIHAATVLYVVQRMTLLATTAVLAGALLYVDGRTRAGADPRAGYVRMALGVFVGTVVGTLCKETAALTPLLLLALETTLLRALPAPAGWRPARAALLGLPAAALLAYLALRVPDFLATYAYRTFTLSERLLTECRVLFVYLKAAFLPAAGGVRVLYDDLPLSTSWLQPWTTIVAVSGWAIVAAAAVRWRERAPVFAFGVAWYLAGSLLEASVVPLEIAFSHRSYLPLLGPSLALAAGFVELAGSPGAHRFRGVLVAAGTVYGVLLLACLVRASLLWGQPLEQARAWTRQQPGSNRALLTYGDRLLRTEDLDTPYRLYRAAWARQPDDAVLALAAFELGCFNAGIEPALAQVGATLRAYRGPDSTVAASIVGRIVTRFEEARCPDQAPADLLSLTEAMLENPWFAPQRFSLYHAGAMTLDLMGDKAAALARIEQALEADPQIPALQQAVLWSVQLGDTARARRHLATAEQSPRIGARKRWLWRREIAGMRQLIELGQSLPGGHPE